MVLTFQRVAIGKMIEMKLDAELNKSRVAVDNLKAMNIDAEYCFRDAERNSAAIKEVVEGKLLQCENDHFATFIDRFNITMTLMRTTRAAMDIINAIYYDCVSRLHEQRICVAKWARYARGYSAFFDEQYVGYLVYRKTISEMVFNSTTQCAQTVTEDFLKEIKQMDIINTSCAEGAE
ncbi:hypothetical protein KM043_018575 [Ampulex compressa]|nr:hypothetical protein KM043_018575 [Ampulex compressa]